MKLLLLILILLLNFPAFAADTVRVCTYNLLQYSLTNENGRNVHFQRIMNYIAPDLLLCQEVDDGNALPKFKTEALNANGITYDIAPFEDGPDSDNALFFNSDKFDLIESIFRPSTIRNIAYYSLRHKLSGDTLHLYTAHFKAGDTDPDKIDRAKDADFLQKYAEGKMIKNKYVIAAGDFNIYDPNEQAYTTLTAQGGTYPPLFDLVGYWQRNSTAHLAKYTQSPRTAADGGCGGGVGGGMNDRFDFLLVSPALQPRLAGIEVVGNDGQNRLNSAINSPANTKYPAEMASALRCASDNLPVFGTIMMPSVTGVLEETQSEKEAKPRYFDILGREIFEPVKGVLYLRVSGGKVDLLQIP